MEFREFHQQSLLRWRNYEKFLSSTFDTFARRKLIEDHNTILELSGRVQELQNEVNCLNDSKDFQDAKSVRSGIPTLPVNRCYSLHILFLKGCWSLLSYRRAAKKAPSIWDTHGLPGNVFANPPASSSALYPQELNSPWKKIIEEPFHMSTAEKSERPEQNRDHRCQSGPSAKDSVIFSGGDSSKNYGADQQRLHISDLHFDTFPTPATFVCWKIRFKTEVCICSQFPTEAIIRLTYSLCVTSRFLSRKSFWISQMVKRSIAKLESEVKNRNFDGLYVFEDKEAKWSLMAGVLRDIFSSASQSKCEDDRVWSSQEWMIETKMYDRLGRLHEIA